MTVSDIARTNKGGAVSVAHIDPATAHRWLAGNTHNRNLRASVVECYAADMAAGRWLFNGDSIKFDANGVLLDGQHRLHAVIKSGVTIECLIVNGLNPEAQETMDAGARRTTGDALRLRGHSNYTALAAVARLIHIWQQGGRTLNPRYKATTAEIVEFIEANPDVVTAGTIAATYRARIPAPTGVVGLTFWLFARLDAEEAELFFMDVAEGIGLPSGDAALALRNRLMSLGAQSSGRARPTNGEYVRLFIRAWNARRDGRPVSKLAAVSRGNNTSIPEPR